MGSENLMNPHSLKILLLLRLPVPSIVLSIMEITDSGKRMYPCFFAPLVTCIFRTTPFEAGRFTMELVVLAQ